MINYSDIKKGTRIIINSQPHEVLEAAPLFRGRGHSVLQVKLKNMITSNQSSETFHPSDSFKEAEIEKIKLKFVYSHRGKYVFAKENNPSDRFELPEEVIEKKVRYLKQNQEVEGLMFKEDIVNIIIPIKIPLKVTEAPPGLKGERSQPGTKTVTLETGAKINVPLFIKEGDIIEVNTESDQYTRRIEK